MSTEPIPRRLKAIIKDPQHCKRVVESLQLFNMRQDFMDLCIVCARGHKVYAHKLLLCSVSTRMKEMLLEIPDNIDLITIHLPDIEARLLRQMFDFLYEGNLRVTKSEYDEFQSLMDLLGIVLRSPSERASQPAPPLPPSSKASAPQLPVQPTAQLVYVQAPNSQGQVQYMLAAPASLPQGQVMQVAQASPQPVIMSQASGQMVQSGSQVVTTQIQQNSMVQVVPQNNNQVVPMSNQMVAGNQIVSGTQIVQCSSQMVVQGNQQTMINNNQMPVGIQSQVAQPGNQRPHYVMSSTANQLTTSRAQPQYSTPQTTPQQRTVARTRTTSQVTQPTRLNAINNVAGHSDTKADILSILQENCDNIETLTGRQIREILEPKLGVDLSDQENLIDQILKSLCGVDETITDGPSNTRKRSPTMKGKRGRKKIGSLSDGEDDEDFEPKKKSRSKKK